MFELNQGKKILVEIGGSKAPQDIANKYICNIETVPNDAMAFGTIAHLCILEPDKISWYLDKVVANNKYNEVSNGTWLDILNEINTLSSLKDSIEIDKLIPLLSMEQHQVLSKLTSVSHQLNVLDDISLGDCILGKEIKLQIETKVEDEIALPIVKTTSPYYDLLIRGKLDFHVKYKDSDEIHLYDVKTRSLSSKCSSKTYSTNMNHYAHLLLRTKEGSVKRVHKYFIWVCHDSYRRVDKILLENAGSVTLDETLSFMKERVELVCKALDKAINKVIESKEKIDEGNSFDNDINGSENSDELKEEEVVEKTKLVLKKEFNEKLNTVDINLFNAEVKQLADKWLSTRPSDIIKKAQECVKNRVSCAALYSFLDTCLINNWSLIGPSPDAYIVFFDDKSNDKTYTPQLMLSYNLLSRKLKEVYNLNVAINFYSKHHVPSSTGPGLVVKKWKFDGVNIIVEYVDDVDIEVLISLSQFYLEKDAPKDTKYIHIILHYNNGTIFAERVYNVAHITRGAGDVWLKYPTQMYGKSVFRKLLSNKMMLSKLYENIKPSEILPVDSTLIG